MEMHAEHSKDISTIIIDKDLFLGFEHETFHNLIQESITKGSKKIFIDLANVKFIASLGIGCIIRAYTTCTNKNILFTIKNANENIMKVFRHLKLAEVLNFI
jgi:anti-anti-sigma factor